MLTFFHRPFVFFCSLLCSCATVVFPSVFLPSTCWDLAGMGCKKQRFNLYVSREPKEKDILNLQNSNKFRAWTRYKCFHPANLPVTIFHSFIYILYFPLTLLFLRSTSLSDLLLWHQSQKPQAEGEMGIIEKEVKCVFPIFSS